MRFFVAVTTVMVAKAATERKMTVDELFQLVENNSKALQQEKISVEFAKKGVAAARTSRLPELTASATVSLNGDVLMMDRNLSNAQGFASPRWGNSLAIEAQQVVYAGGAVDAGNEDGIRHCQQFVINYEDSIRHRYEMEQQVAKKDSTAKRLMMESDKIRKMLE